MVVGGIGGLAAVEGEGRWAAAGVAALVAGGLAGRYYKVIIGIGAVAVVLLVAALVADESDTGSPSPASHAATPQVGGEASTPEAQRRAELQEKARDQARTTPFPPAPNTIGNLFHPDEVDVYVNKVTKDAYIIHSKVIDYSAISYLEYHYQDNWVAIVLTDGRRLDLGVHIQWLIRPYWRQATQVLIGRRQDGKFVDSKLVALRKVGVQP